MPRYFITTSDQEQTHGQDGLILSGPDELAQILRQTLATMLHDDSGDQNQTEIAASAHDAHGDHVMGAKLSMTTLRE